MRRSPEKPKVQELLSRGELSMHDLRAVLLGKSIRLRGGKVLVPKFHESPKKRWSWLRKLFS